MAEDQTDYDPNKNAPFKEALVHSNVGSEESDPKRSVRLKNKIMTLASRPDTVIRIQNEEPQDTVDSQIEYVHTAKKLFDELGEKYEIAVLPVAPVIGGQKNDLETWVVTDKVHGTRLRELLLDNPSEEVKDKSEKLYSNLVKYLTDKRNNGEMFLSDIFHNRQYILGTTANNLEKELYLTDYDFYLGPALVDTDEECQTGFIDSINNLVFTINEFTELTGRPGTETRTRLSDLLSSIKPLNEDNEYVLEQLIKFTDGDARMPTD